VSPAFHSEGRLLHVVGSGETVEQALVENVADDVHAGFEKEFADVSGEFVVVDEYAVIGWEYAADAVSDV